MQLTHSYKRRPLGRAEVLIIIISAWRGVVAEDAFYTSWLVVLRSGTRVLRTTRRVMCTEEARGGLRVCARRVVCAEAGWVRRRAAVCACGGVRRRRRVASALGTEAMHQRSSEQTWPGLIGSGSAIFMWSASWNALNLP